MSQATHLSKARAIGSMFERIAPRYDLMNRLMSLGMDRSWRRLAVEAARPAPGGLGLDIGAGTGDLTLELARSGRPRFVVGADLSAGMLSVARAKVESSRLVSRIDLIQADVANLPFRDGAFDCITTAFMVRNLAGLPAALIELKRILSDGGRLVILEITRPQPGPASRLFALYFHHVVPLIGGLISGDRAAYRYLPASVDRFLSTEELSQALREAGYAGVTTKRLGPGPVVLCAGVKGE